MENCGCKSSCSTKDGRKRKGCPCKTAERFCSDLCMCGSSRNPCKNKSGMVRTRARPQESNQTSRPPADRPSELTECELENNQVERLILDMEEETVKRLAIRVLSRGIGSLEFIQSQLDDRPTNFYGSPVASPAQSSVHSQPPSPIDIEHVPQSSINEQGRDEVLHSTPMDMASEEPNEEPITSNEKNSPQWCICGRCQPMPQEIENRCCRKRTCVTQTYRFYKLCLDTDVLQLGILNRADIRNDPFDNSSRQFRKAAYRNFILDKHGYLGRGVRRVVPSCCVLRVRVKFPSPTGVYLGFKEA